MRIVMLGPFGLHPKGTMQARALPAARALARCGHAVTILMPPWHTPAEAGRRWRDEASGVQLEYLELGALKWPVVGHVLLGTRMARRAMALGPDVVHAFKPKAYSGLAALALRSRRRFRGTPPLVLDTDDWEGPGGWNDLEPYSPAQRRVFAWQEKWGLRHSDAVTVASRALQTLVWSVGVKPASVHYLPNAMEKAAIEGFSHSQRARRSGPRAPTILLYTRFFEFDLVRPLEVLAQVRNERANARLIVAGRGLFGEEARFEELARERGLGEAVEYLGWIEPDALAGLVADADLALYPFDDTLVNRTKSSVKLLELMAAGAPIVAEAVGQNTEVIGNTDAGWLVSPGDTEMMARAALELIARPDRRRAMSQAARTRVAERYCWDEQIEVLEATYESIAAGSVSAG